MIGLDTNVLVRILVDDGSDQVGAARRFAAEQASLGERLLIDRVVLAEAVSALATVFGYERGPIAAVVERILANGAYDVDDREIVVAAWTKYRDGSADFADCLIAAKHASMGCTFTATFDRGMRALPTTRVLR